MKLNNIYKINTMNVKHKSMFIKLFILKLIFNEILSFINVSKSKSHFCERNLPFKFKKPKTLLL